MQDLWKKYQVVFWIEVVFLCIMAVCAGGLYWTERCSQVSNARTVMKTIQSDIYEAARGDKNAEEMKRLAVEEIMDTVDSDGNLFYCIRLNVYNRSGNVSSSIGGTHLSCVWRIRTENGIESEWCDLDNYFTEEQLSDFFDFYTENGKNMKGREGCCIQNMMGFYRGVKFIPVEIVFADRNTGNEIYVLQNTEKLTNLRDENKVYRLDHITQDTLEYPEQTETGYFSFYIYAPSGKLYSKAADLVYTNGNGIVSCGYENSSISDNKSLYYKPITGNSNCSGYSCAICVDLAGMIRASGHLRKILMPILFFLQGLAVFVICVYLYIKKKQGKLAAMRNTFINAIAHEMKTPAAVIQNSTECLQAGIHPEKQGHYMEMIHKEADHMNELLNSMLIYTRVTDAVYKIQKEECSLAKMAEDICRHYEDAVEEKQITLIWDKNEPELVHCDIKLMEMVLDNLFSNAVKFCASPGVIRISLSGKSIGIFNEGKELTEEELEHIWEPLYRSDESRTYENGSSGMGLAISSAILRLHGADYGVKNVSEGVEFYLKLK